MSEHIFESANIDLQLQANSEMQTIAAMLELVGESGAIADVNTLADDLLTQEIYHRTTTSHCALLFHAVSRSVAKMQLYFGRFADGIGYYSHSGHPIDLVFLLAANPQEREAYQDVLNKLEGALQHAATRESLRSAAHREEIIQIVMDILTN